MPSIRLSSKRAFVPLTQTLWTPVPVTSIACPGTTRTIRSSPPHDAEDIEFTGNDNDFILSILRAKPSIRDTKSYLASFTPRGAPVPAPTVPKATSSQRSNASSTNVQARSDTLSTQTDTIIRELIDPVHRRTALVKLQGPFSERQLESIARGMVYLGKLGLVSVIVVENDNWEPGSENEREDAVEDAMRIVAALEAQGVRARPLLDTVVRLGPEPEEEGSQAQPAEAPPVRDARQRRWVPEAHALPEDLLCIRFALRAGEIPVIPALALDSFYRSVRVSANDVIAALTRTMARAGVTDKGSSSTSQGLDLTPLRLMIINREGGVPSYARSGLPHLLVNLSSEYDQIVDTFLPQWQHTHPTALDNLALARTCLSYMPRTSSAIMVSHRSPSSLIANLITNKPAQSSSLPHALLSGARKLTQHTPTIFRHGLPIRIIRNVEEIDRDKMTTLLEQSFGRKLDYDAFWKRIDDSLDFAIVAGDYRGGAVVTRESLPSPPGEPPRSMMYLDKFAVLPSHQGDGTVDFLWVVLHDESYGLGTPFARNFIEGGREGLGNGEDLVWKSRANNPVNKWYYERSSGHLRMGEKGEWVLFWCDAEDRLRDLENAVRAGDTSLGSPDVIRTRTGIVKRGPSYVPKEESGRIESWAQAVRKIPSSWKKVQ